MKNKSASDFSQVRELIESASTNKHQQTDFTQKSILKQSASKPQPEVC